MLYYLNKDITTVEEGIVAHGVNCQGVMASGVAKAIREKWPEVYESYIALYRTVPSLSVYAGEVQEVKINDNLIVCNCLTQVYYGSDGKPYAKVSYVSSCMHLLDQIAHRTKMPIYMPKIGCGLGGLSWEKDVEPIVKELAEGVDVYVCEI